MPCERAPDPAAAERWIDDHADLADVARPARQRDERDVADDLVVLDRDGPRGAESRPRGDHVGVVDLLLEERPVPFRDARHELLDGVVVARFESPDLHQRSFAGSSSSLCSTSHFVSPGSVRWSACRPAKKVTCPPVEPQLVAPRRIADEPERRLGGGAAGRPCPSRRPRRGRCRARGRSRPRGRSAACGPLISTLRRTRSATTCRIAAPGNGTCSRDHCAIACHASTNSSFQRFWSSVACRAISVVGACMRKAR